jgi:hypothetical protein
MITQVNQMDYMTILTTFNSTESFKVVTETILESTTKGRFKFPVPVFAGVNKEDAVSCMVTVSGDHFRILGNGATIYRAPVLEPSKFSFVQKITNWPGAGALVGSSDPESDEEMEETKKRLEFVNVAMSGALDEYLDKTRLVFHAARQSGKFLAFATTESLEQLGMNDLAHFNIDEDHLEKLEKDGRIKYTLASTLTIANDLLLLKCFQSNYEGF